MQQQPKYNDVVAEVEQFLLQRAAAAEQAGIKKSQILLDPGFGFGKSLQHNISLLAALPRLSNHGMPLLVGVSRKSMFAQLLGRTEISQRLAGSLAVAAWAVQAGAAILRVHDVAETADVIQVMQAIEQASRHNKEEA